MKRMIMSWVLVAGTLSGSVVYGQWKMQPVPIQTRWAKGVKPDNVLPEYPRPQMVRKKWANLNGLWQYAVRSKDQPMPDSYDGSILVPYPLESALSGVKKNLLPGENLWYRRTFKRPSGETIMLHFGAVDQETTVFVNGKNIGHNSGGYTSFSFDITSMLQDGENELVVKVYDPTDAGFRPHGKQVLNPANIYYTPTSGIWQTVWLEALPVAHIDKIVTTPDIDKGLVYIDIGTTDSLAELELKVVGAGKLVAKKNGKPGTFIIPIDNAKLWSPSTPFLYDLIVRLKKNGKFIDEVSSYFGMRKIAISKDEKGVERIYLNNRPFFNFGTLDQGFWPEGLYTAPTDEALAFDIMAIKAMGFNTIRKHIKIEPERWYYYADKFGVLVWQDFVNPHQALPDGSKAAYEQEQLLTIKQLYNHPSIVVWVVFNERWGAYDQHRITEYVKQADPSRVVNGHSGEYLYVNKQLRQVSEMPYAGSDLTDVHAYPDPLNAMALPGKARVLGEFGGIGVLVSGHQWDDLKGWGYIQVSPSMMKETYQKMLNSLKKLRDSGLSASIYTQPFDVEGEENGLMTYDREVIKIPLNKLREMHKDFIGEDYPIPKALNIGRNIETGDTEEGYSQLKLLFNNGRRDSAFLRRLTTMCIRLSDSIAATRVGNEYISQLKETYSVSNLLFISYITRCSRDTGFMLFRNNANRINEVLKSPYFAERKVINIISDEEIKPYTTSVNIKPDWNAILTACQSKYGNLGSEAVYGHCMVYSSTINDWKEFSRNYRLYYETAMKRSFIHTNNMSWLIFEHETDIELLSFAVDVMKYDLEHYSGHDPMSIDTYANLLYKTGRKEEAIRWEQKAAALDGSLNETLQKMIEGKPTWPLQ